MCPYIEIFGVKFGTYGLCLVVGFFLAGILAMCRGRPLGLRWEDILIIAAMAFGCAMLLGGLLYVFVTYSAAQILAFISRGDFRFLGSGIVFYGGLIGGILGAILGIRIAKCDLRVAEHAIVPFIPVGHAVGRIGCVMGGCCYGFEYDGLFALYYPHSLAGLPPNQGYFPVQLLEALLNLGISFLLLRLGKKTKRALDLLAWYLLFYSVTRFFLEMLRGDAIRGTYGGISTSQLISIAILALCSLRWLVLQIHDRVTATNE